MARRSRALCLGLALAFCAMLLAPAGSAGSATVLSASLPTARHRTAAVWDGAGNAYVFGGDTPSGNTDEILRFTPATGTVATMPAVLPDQRSSIAAVWDGTANAYVFGADNTGSKVVRYTPATNTVTKMSGGLPTDRFDVSAVWDGAGNAYLFGGVDTGGRLDQIVRYTPATNAVAVMSATLPSARFSTSAVWDGAGNAYIFAGSSDSGSLNQIVRYTPATNTVTVMPSTLPWASSGTSAVWDGAGSAYVFISDRIVRYTPATGTVVELTTRLPSARFGASAVWDGTITAYLFGGWTGSALLADIVKFDATIEVPSAPRFLSATAGPAAGQIELDWFAPSDNGDGPITSYNVYRGTASGSETFLATVGNVLTYTDSGLPNGATRYYKVTAVNAAGESVRSNGASARTYIFPASAPQNVEASAGPGAGQITLTWDPPADNGGSTVTGYKVYRGTSSGSQPFLASVGNVLTFTDSGLPEGATRHYRVRAVNGAGDGTQSPVVSATAFSRPSAPQNLQATPGTNGAVTLVWQAPATTGGTPVTSYSVYRSAGGPEVLHASVGGSSFTYTDQECPAGSACSYRVAAANLVGEGAKSASASAPSTAAPDVRTQDDLAGGCTVYLDRDHDGQVDSGEALAVLPCVPDLATRDNGDGTLTVYNDRDHDGAVDAGEPLATLGYVDADGDLVPDADEPTLCANENPNLLSEGHCVGDDYVPPTAEDLLSDLTWLITGERP